MKARLSINCNAILEREVYRCVQDAVDRVILSGVLPTSQTYVELIALEITTALEGLLSEEIMQPPTVPVKKHLLVICYTAVVDWFNSIFRRKL